MTGGACSGVVECLAAFQTLIAGVLAMLIAAITAYVIFHAARIPVQAENERRRKENYLRMRLRCLELSEEYNLLRRRAKQGQGTVKVYKAANKEVSERVLERMLLTAPLSTQDWLFMSLIPEELARKCIHFNGLLHDHNFDMERAGGAFGDDNYGKSISDRLKAIEEAATDLKMTFADHERVISTAG